MAHQSFEAYALDPISGVGDFCVEVQPVVLAGDTLMKIHGSAEHILLTKAQCMAFFELVEAPGTVMQNQETKIYGKVVPTF